MGIIRIDLNNINLDDTNYDDPETIIHIRLLVWHIKSEKRKAVKKKLNEELEGWSRSAVDTIWTSNSSLRRKVQNHINNKIKIFNTRETAIKVHTFFSSQYVCFSGTAELSH